VEVDAVVTLVIVAGGSNRSDEWQLTTRTVKIQPCPPNGPIRSPRSPTRAMAPFELSIVIEVVRAGPAGSRRRVLVPAECLRRAAGSAPDRRRHHDHRAARPGSARPGRIRLIIPGWAGPRGTSPAELCRRGNARLNRRGHACRVHLFRAPFRAGRSRLASTDGGPRPNWQYAARLAAAHPQVHRRPARALCPTMATSLTSAGSAAGPSTYACTSSGAIMVPRSPITSLGGSLCRLTATGARASSSSVRWRSTAIPAFTR